MDAASTPDPHKLLVYHFEVQVWLLCARLLLSAIRT